MRNEGERLVLISHAPDSDSSWNTIKNAIELAGEQMSLDVDYRNPPTGDLADVARIVEQAAASDPDAILTLAPTPAHPTIAALDDAGLEGEIEADELQDLMAGGPELAELESSLGGTA